MTATNVPQVSILIKALNEEAKIAACLQSAVRESAEAGGEVILADSLSTDRTVAIAHEFPVRVVQFSRVSDRGCGAGVQLAFQHAHGEYLYVLDGDMILQPGFLPVALRYLQANPDVAGVAGKLVDASIKTVADKRRVDKANELRGVVEVSDLAGGGLYRRSAVESVGYLAHRGLPACEEAELGVRLRARGWRLVRLPDVAVVHEGHSENSMGMLRRLWRNRRMHAYGMFLRSALGKPWWWRSVRRIWFVFAAPAAHLVAVAMGLLFASGKSVWTAMGIAEISVWLLVLLALSIRKRELSIAAFSIIEWHFYTVATVVGAGTSVADPMEPIDGCVIAN